MKFSTKVNLEVVLRLNVQLWSRDMPPDQELKKEEIGELVVTFYAWNQCTRSLKLKFKNIQD